MLTQRSLLINYVPRSAARPAPFALASNAIGARTSFRPRAVRSERSFAISDRR
jgi:hypothetical protein